LLLFPVLIYRVDSISLGLWTVFGGEMGDVFVLTYSDLLEEIEAVVSHHLLSFGIQVDSGLGLRL